MNVQSYSPRSARLVPFLAPCSLAAIVLAHTITGETSFTTLLGLVGIALYLIARTMRQPLIALAPAPIRR